MERGEGIVGDLRLGGADCRQEGRLAGIGQPDDTGVGDQLEPQPDMHLLALLAWVGMARRLVGRRLEMCIAEAAIAASKQHDALAGLGQVRDQGLAVIIDDLRTGRHFQHHVGAVGTGAILALAVAALLCLEMLLVAVVEQRVEIGHALDDHVAAFAAVAAVRATELDELLPPEADAAVAAVARAHIDLGLIEKLHGKGLPPASFQYTSGEARAPRQLRSCRTRLVPRRGRAGRSGNGPSRLGPRSRASRCLAGRNRIWR